MNGNAVTFFLNALLRCVILKNFSEKNRINAIHVIILKRKHSTIRRHSQLNYMNIFFIDIFNPFKIKKVSRTFMGLWRLMNDIAS